MAGLRRPALWDREFERVLESAGGSADRPFALDPAHPLRMGSGPVALPKGHVVSRIDDLLTIDNLTAPGSQSPSEQLTSIFTSLSNLLSEQYGLPTAAIASSTLLLRSMASFTVLNPIYASFFPAPNPPARVTVSCGESLPEGVDVVLSVVVDTRDPSTYTKNALHVQSRSYWAPANIGPYSQSVSVPLRAEPQDGTSSTEDAAPQLFFMAGQIPLEPASMEILDLRMFQKLQQDSNANLDAFWVQAVLSLQHLWRVGQAVGVQWWTSGMAFLSECGEEESQQRAEMALSVWRKIHERLPEDDTLEESEDVDVWDIQNRVSAMPDGGAEEEDAMPKLPDWSVVESGGHIPPPVFVVEVSELPRGASVEWTALGLAGCPVALEPFGDEMVGLSQYATDLRGTDVRIYCYGVKDPQALAQIPGLLAAEDGSDSRLGQIQYTLYTTPGVLDQGRVDLSRGQIVPCRRIWNSTGERIAAAVVARKTMPTTLDR
jgi:diphthine-ammonia ligase